MDVISLSFKFNYFKWLQGEGFISKFCFIDGVEGFMEEVYANGNDFDSWCRSHSQIPKAMYTTYISPVCGNIYCWRASITNNVTKIDGSAVACNVDEQNTNPLFFICM